MPRGIQIAFDGIDGSGKDTQADLLTEFLAHLNPLRINKPTTERPIGKILRQFLAEGESIKSHAALFLAEDFDLTEMLVNPALQEGRPVICARSFLSSLVYQQETWDLCFLQDLYQRSQFPDVTVVLDVDPEMGAFRREKRPGKDEYYEKIDMQRRFRQRYQDLIDDKDEMGCSVVMVDGTGDPYEVFGRVKEALLDGLAYDGDKLKAIKEAMGIQ